MRRSGRLTFGQKAGLNELWQYYGVDCGVDILNLKTLFIKPQPVILEVGFGNGDSLLQMAMRADDKNFLGIEVYEAGIGRLINEAHKRSLSNLKIINADAFEVLENNIMDNSFEAFWLFFPDPWHKKKHHKRRLVQANFLDLIAKKVVNSGIIHLATDWEHYAQQMMTILENHPHFQNTQNPHHYSPKPEYRPLTKFEKRGAQLGHQVWDLIFICKK